MIDRLTFLSAKDHRLISQIQGRSYANIFGLVERFIGAKILEVSQDHWLGDQTALEALVRFTDEELKHQELFRRVETMVASEMPQGYRFTPQPNEVAAAVLGKSTWAALAPTCHIELFTQAHYRASIAPDDALSDVWKDVFLYHWREESQHAILDELQWQREDAKLTASQRDQGVTDLIALVAAVDEIVVSQAHADADYFIAIASRHLKAPEQAAVHDAFVAAYRHQYIVSGAQDPRFQSILGSLVNAEQAQRIFSALGPIIERVQTTQTLALAA